jgi:TonB family protein
MNADKIGLALVACLGLCVAAEAPTPTKIVPIEYPRIGRYAQVQGTAELHVRVSRDGTVTSAKVGAGNSLLAGYTLEPVKKWRFHALLR